MPKKPSYGLDYTLPWILGIAQKMIRRGIKAMINPFTGNVVINKFGKVFELVPISEVLKDVYIIFLIKSPTEYAVWQFDLTDGILGNPLSFNLAGVTTEIDKTAPTFYNTLKSNKDLTRHHYLIEDLTGYNDPTYWKYGMRVAATDMWGIANCYQPSDFLKASDYEWDTTFLDTNLPVTFPLSVGQIICRARNIGEDPNDSNKTVKNLRCVLVDAGTPSEERIKWEDENGTQTSSTWVSFENMNGLWAKKFFAVIGPEKMLWVDYETAPVTKTINPTVADSLLTGGRDCLTESLSYTTGNAKPSTEIITNGLRFMFGDVLLGEYAEASSYSLQTTTYEATGASIVSGWSGPLNCCTHNLTTIQHRRRWEGALSVNVLDFDHKNEDETFIVFYYKEFGNPAGPVYLERAQEVSAGQPTPTPKYHGTVRQISSGSAKNYLFSYRLNGGTVVHVNLDITFGYGQIDETTSSDWLTATDGDGCEYSYVTYNSNIVTKTWGAKIGNLTTKISDNFILYSYCIYDYTGAVATERTEDLDYDPNYWTFRERIMGIINITTGVRTEHIVNDALLGNYSSSFNEDEQAAIGLSLIKI
jgi:hypothetical protein